MDQRSSSIEMMRKQEDLKSSQEYNDNNKVEGQPKSKFSPIENYRYHDYQSLDRGDTKQNSAIVSNNTSYQYPTEYLAAGEYRKDPSAESIHQNKLHQEAYPSRTESSQETKQLRFTSAMLRDQESLLTSMNQQRIPEPLIRRQFDRLLEEQTKQLRKLQEEAKVAEKKLQEDVLRYEKKVEPERINYTIAEKPSCVNYVPEKSCGEPNCSCSAPITQNKYESGDTQQQYQQQQHYQQTQQYQTQQLHQQQQPQQQQQHPQFYQQKYQQYHQPQQSLQFQQQQSLQHQQQYQQNYQQQIPQEFQQQHRQIQEQYHTSERQADENSQQGDHMTDPNRLRKVEPSSLLKIRLQKETMGSHGRNNGLQDSATAMEIIKKCSYGQRKNKYGSSNVDRSEMCARLNGAQDRSEMEQQLPKQPVCERTVEKRHSSNGLENVRDPNNPPLNYKSWRVKKAQEDDQQSITYPPQRLPMAQHTYQQAHHNQHHTSQSEHPANYQPTGQSSYTNNTQGLMMMQSQHQQPATLPHCADNGDNAVQSSNAHNMAYCPEYHEPKVIGGFTYFARKPQCIPNVPGRLCDEYGSVGNTKPATAF